MRFPIAAASLVALLPLAAAAQTRELPALTGYTDRLSVAPGETIRFMVSTEAPEFEVQFVRLIHGDPHPRGPGFKAEPLETPAAGRYPGRRQLLNPGSHVEVGDAPALRLAGSFTLQAWIHPTTPDAGVQGILTKWDDEAGGYGLFLDESGVSLWIGDGERVERVGTGAPLRRGRWYFVLAAFDAERGVAEVVQEPIAPWAASREAVSARRDVTVGGAAASPVPLLIGAASGRPDAWPGRHYNGKIDSPRIFAHVLDDAERGSLRDGGSPLELARPPVAAWDFSQDAATSRITDLSPGSLHGRTVNTPMRAATGYAWTGRVTDFRDAPSEYGAIHFHDDDLVDAGWDADFELAVPADARSGVYAATIRAGELEDDLPFFVTPAPDAATAPIAFLAPTFNYQAYGNYKTGIPGLLSLYDHHSDGSGVAYASHLTPLLDMRPRLRKELSESGEHFARHLSADLYLVDWLEARGFDYDVITDHDLDREGAALLAPYRTVITGSHPEYVSERMLDGLESYLADGGRLMYLGGNGFYWVTSRSAEQPEVLEVRRWAGTRHWEAAPGEYHHSTTGELGGLWRYRGRAPQRLVGVGFTAQGWMPAGTCALARPYRRLPDSFDPRAAFVFEGVAEDEPISDFPSLLLGEGAAGDEIDRFDPRLGSPDHALVLATADDFSLDYQPVVEEVRGMNAGTTTRGRRRVRADMVYFEYPGGGAVFSVGSIAWLGSLSYGDYENDVSRITGNVLRRFASEETLP